MKSDTPLAEVAHHLPLAVAGILDDHSQDVQMRVLMTVRACVVYWEKQGVQMDPLVYDSALTAVVISVAAAQTELERLSTEASMLRQQNYSLNAQLAAIQALLVGDWNSSGEVHD